MLSTKHPLIAREGWGFIGSAVILAATGWYLYGFTASLPIWLIAAVLVFLFRDPARRIPAAPLGVVCPADGTVQAVERTKDPCLGRDAWRIKIRMQALGVHSVRSPVEGRVVKQGYLSSDGRRRGRRYAVWVQTDEGDQIVWTVAGTAVRCPYAYIQPGARVGQGQRCGFVFLGGGVEVYMPFNARVEVAAGERVAAGEALLSTLVHKPARRIETFAGTFAAD